VDKGTDKVAGENGVARAGVPLTGTLRGGYCYARVHLATFKHSILCLTLRPSRCDTCTSGSCLSYLLMHPALFVDTCLQGFHAMKIYWVSPLYWSYDLCLTCFLLLSLLSSAILIGFCLLLSTSRISLYLV
jgi:hypothetical protein